jgi:hypothetical protein
MKKEKSIKNGVLVGEAAYILGAIPQTAKAELLDWITPSEASEHVLKLMSYVTQTDEWAHLTHETKDNFWFKSNLIRAVLFDLQKK